MKKVNLTIMVKNLTIILIVLSSIQVKAQKTEFGIRFMPTLTGFDINTPTGATFEGKQKNGYGIGVLLGYNFTNHISVQGEVSYEAIEQSSSDANNIWDMQMKYINVPIFFVLNTGKDKILNFKFLLGPQIGFALSHSFSVTDKNEMKVTEPYLRVRDGDLGIGYGVGGDWKINKANNVRVNFGVRGVFGSIGEADNRIINTAASYYMVDRPNVKTYTAYLGLTWLF